MSYKDFYNDITQNTLKSLYVLYGMEKLMIDRMIEQLRDVHLSAQFVDFNFITREGEGLSYQDAMTMVERLPIMDAKQIIVIREPSFMTSTEWADVELENFIRYHQGNETTITLLCMHNIDKRKSIYKKIKQIGAVINFDKLDEVTLCKWMIQEVKKLGKTMDMATSMQLAMRLGYLNRESDLDLYGVLSIIQRICFSIKEEKLSEKILEEVLDQSIEANIFKMIDALFEGNKKVTFKQLQSLLNSGEVPIKMLFMIHRHIRQLLNIKLLLNKGYSSKSICEKLNLKPFVVNKAIRQLKNLSLSYLNDMLKKATLCDLQMKSSIDGRIALEHFMVTLLSYQQVCGV